MKKTNKQKQFEKKVIDNLGVLFIEYIKKNNEKEKEE